MPELPTNLECTEFSPMAEFLNGVSPRYFTPRMRTHIVANTCVGESHFGKGLFAKRNLEKGMIVGYYSGPVLTWNNALKYEAEEDYVAGGCFVHPDSKKKMSYQVLVVGPTRYMNHGHRPEYYHGKMPQHDMIANVAMLSEKMVKIGNGHRPVFVFKTRRCVKRGAELLYDYGVHQDEIYYEVLRRQNASDTKIQRRSFSSIITSIEKSRYEKWKTKLFRQFCDEWDSRNAFFHLLLVEFLNSPDTILYPTRTMV